MRFFLPLFWIFCGVLLAAGETNEVAPGVLQIGTIENSDVNESSGLASSRKPNIVWTHNDTGKPVLYAMTPDGQSVADWELKNVDVKNWEDVTRSGNQLYVADIGNDDLSRDHVEVYRANEPSTKKSGDLKPNRAWRISYADQPFDAESLFIQRRFRLRHRAQSRRRRRRASLSFSIVARDECNLRTAIPFKCGRKRYRGVAECGQ